MLHTLNVLKGVGPLVDYSSEMDNGPVILTESCTYKHGSFFEGVPFWMVKGKPKKDNPPFLGECRFPLKTHTHTYTHPSICCLFSPPDRKGLLDFMLESAFAMLLHHAPTQYPARAARYWIPPSIPPERLSSGSRRVSRQSSSPVWFCLMSKQSRSL